MNDLFLDLWRNIVIKNEIIMHLKLYNLNSSRLIEISNVQDLIEYRSDPQKEYIKTIVLKRFNKHNNNKKLIMDNLSKQVENLKLFDGFSFGYNSYDDSGIDNNGSEVDEEGDLLQFKNGFIPDNITHLSICLDNHNYQITNQTFPSNLKYLSLGYNYDLPILPNQLPQSLTRLRIPKTCSSKLNVGSLPNGLLILEIGNQDTTTINEQDGTTISILPSSLHSIYFNVGYNKLFNSNSFSLCNSLTYLNFQANVKQPLSKDWLPCTLETLIIRSSYTQPQSIISLPDSIKVFTINGSLVSDNEYQLPTSLKKFTFDGTLIGISLPSTLEILKYKKFDSTQLYKAGFLPDGLKELTVICKYTEELIYPTGLIKLSKVMSIKQLLNLPQSIEIIKFGIGFSDLIPDGLISNFSALKSIVFSQNSSVDISNGTNLPLCLEYLEYGINSKFNVELYKEHSLKTLIISKQYTPFNHPRFTANNYIPNLNLLSIQSLKFSTSFNVDYDSNKLPQSLTLLDIEFTSNKEMTIKGLPQLLNTLIIRDGDNITFPVSSIPPSLKSIVFVDPGEGSVVYELTKIPEFFKITHIIKKTQYRDKIFQKKVKSLNK